VDTLFSKKVENFFAQKSRLLRLRNRRRWKISFLCDIILSIRTTNLNLGEEKMIIRKYQPSDCKELTELFYNTVHNVNAKDYAKEQLDVWATGKVDFEKWNESLQEHFSVVAVDDEIIVGFGDIDKTGYLDRLFVHADYQRKGIATAICNQLEQAVQGNITTHASITAKPFFEKRDYKIVKEQQVERQGIFLTNYVMIKER